MATQATGITPTTNTRETRGLDFTRAGLAVTTLGITRVTITRVATTRVVTTPRDPLGPTLGAPCAILQSTATAHRSKPMIRAAATILLVSMMYDAHSDNLNCTK